MWLWLWSQQLLTLATMTMSHSSFPFFAVVASSAVAVAFVPPLRHHYRHSYSYPITINTLLSATEGDGEKMQLEGKRNSFLDSQTVQTTSSSSSSSFHLDNDNSNSNNYKDNNNEQPLLESLLDQAQQKLVSMKQEIGSQSSNEEGIGASDAATVLFDILAQAFQLDPTSSKVSGMFIQYLTWKVHVAEHKYHNWKKRHDTFGSFSQHSSHLETESSWPESSNEDDLHYNNKDNNYTEKDAMFSEKEMNEYFQDRIGLSSLYIDREQYDSAGKQLRVAIDEATHWIKCSSDHDQPQQTKERPPMQYLSSRHQEGQTDDLSSSSPYQHWQPQIDRARYLLYRTNAACCQWGSYFEDGDRLRQSLLLQHRDQRYDAAVHNINGTSSSSSTTTRPSPSSGIKPQLPIQLLVHPFDALKFPCISLELASAIAKSYANRSLEAMGVIMDDDNAIIKPRLPRTIVTVDRHGHDNQHRREFGRREKKIRIGYISPDFTSRHPLAFLMQNVFACHDKSQFIVNIYSLSSPDDGQEVKAILESSDQFTYFSPSTMSPSEMYQRILQDELDILIDLCGYAGTSIMSEIMASRYRLRQDEHQRFRTGSLDQRRSFPIHVSYMGFPGSVGSSMIWDYSVFDKVVIPIEAEHQAGGNIRCNYEEALVYMPHSYFVNSHKSAIGGKGDGIMLMNEDERKSLRLKYGIPPSAFVYCCHSRPDKIDPTTFRSWLRALSRVWSEYQLALSATVDDAACCGNFQTHPVLWLLRSGDEMENNIRCLVKEEFGEAVEENCLVFADIAERREHLHRLGIADLFLDTPSYGAHTLGCDALYLGVPMVSLLRDDEGVYDANVDPSWTSAFADTEPSIGVCFPQDARSIATNKLASRVGASLLSAIGLDKLVCSDMAKYEDAMIKCALDKKWFDTVRQQLHSSKDTSPLFDTKRWIQNLEVAFESMVEQNLDGDIPDIVILDRCG